ncbi:MAG TPA: S-methyl-5-thioribose-1-phosphate isomerase [Candidatus Methanomethylophilaceae archaeon]|nr:S-methyl-5-thioribose-1-phosphate isomerase [Candidatus Methanomethylophilaceae archaeon]
MKVNRLSGKEDMKAVWYEDGKVIMIDQRKLPGGIEIVSFDDYRDVAEAIRNMTVRGAPSIGASAAYAMCLAARSGEDLERAADEIKSSRPTANDLFYAVDSMTISLNKGMNPVVAAEAYAQSMIDKCIEIGRFGESLIKEGSMVMTHCNAGALATVDVGTALAPMRAARDAGKKFFVYVSETRPRLQGMQLTAWELVQEGIDHAIIPDGASAHYMSKGTDLIITGADRIAANGDFANKIGTLDKAISAKYYGVPFYVAAPISTFDFDTKKGEDIVIEHRDESEVTEIYGHKIAPEGSKALNPAFDVTPADLVKGFITEKGIFKPNEISKVME